LKTSNNRHTQKKPNSEYILRIDPTSLFRHPMNANPNQTPDYSDCSAPPAKLVFIGLGWFPTSPGGNERYVYELTHQLATTGDEVELCAVSLPKDPVETPLTLTPLCEKEESFLKRLQKTKANFSQRRIQNADAINIHFPLYGFPVLPVLPPKTPITLTFHGPWALESQAEGANQLSVGFKKFIEQRVYNRMTRFLVLSRAFGEVLHQNYGIPWDKINVVPGGVDVDRFTLSQTRQEARSALNWPQDKFILFTPRRLVNRMGLDKLIDVIGQLAPDYPEIWLAIAGKGILRKELEQRVQNKGLSEQIRFLGFLPDEVLPTAYQAANLTIIPSQALEGFGLILLESLACGTPVTCTPVGGMPEVIQAFTPDLIMKGTDTEAIALALKAVLSGDLTLPSRDQCRNYVTQNFDWRDISQKVKAVLVQAI
jgi:glycosyltransferase involved in cell wall biosynthesis